MARDRSPREHSPGEELLDVWGDTVDRRHLRLAVLIGGAGGLVPLLIADELIPHIEENAALAHAYALLVGLVACVLVGGLCAKLFAPKRIVVEAGTDDEARAEVLDALRGERHGLGSIDDLPAATVAELRELELLDLFTQPPAGTTAARDEVRP
jgi:hypothetical protein